MFCFLFGFVVVFFVCILCVFLFVAFLTSSVCDGRGE